MDHLGKLLTGEASLPNPLAYGSDQTTSIGTDYDWDVVFVLPTPLAASKEEQKEAPSGEDEFPDVESPEGFFHFLIDKLAAAGLEYKSYYSIQGDALTRACEALSCAAGRRDLAADSRLCPAGRHHM